MESENYSSSPPEVFPPFAPSAAARSRSPPKPDEEEKGGKSVSTWYMMKWGGKKWEMKRTVVGGHAFVGLSIFSHSIVLRGLVHLLGLVWRPPSLFTHLGCLFAISTESCKFDDVGELNDDRTRHRQTLTVFRWDASVVLTVLSLSSVFSGLVGFSVRLPVAKEGKE